MGEDVAPCGTQPGLRLATKDAVIHSLAPVVDDVVVEQAERVHLSLLLKSLTVLLDIFHWLAIRVGPSPSFSPSRMASRSSLDRGSRLELRAGFSRSFSNSSAIGGFFLVGGIPLRGVLNVTLCRPHVI